MTYERNYLNSWNTTADVSKLIEQEPHLYISVLVFRSEVKFGVYLHFVLYSRGVISLLV